MIEIKNINKTYKPKSKNKVTAIKGVDLQFSRHGLVFLLGKSGSGKSTFLNILGGLDSANTSRIYINEKKLLVKLLKYQNGNISFDGKDLKEFNDAFYEDIGVCFEMPISFSKLTAMENLEFFQQLYKNHADIQPLMERVGLWEDRNKLAGDYSKGMKIRLNLVRALLNKPKMLFLI